MLFVIELKRILVRDQSNVCLCLVMSMWKINHSDELLFKLEERFFQKKKI